MFRVAAVSADGVGREVVAAGRAVLDALGVPIEWTEFPWGSD